ncbi:hypothetical protein RYH80_19625 [Halobaculum sp. MBLA0147]|uniref:hypothetical protein n=1 Tax=Halobaculum sp. MBLA0147 TaxID=3079934 RepID=UPI003524508D
MALVSKYHTNPWFASSRSSANERLVDAVSEGDEVTIELDRVVYTSEFGSTTPMDGERFTLTCLDATTDYVAFEHLPDETVRRIEAGGDEVEELHCRVTEVNRKAVGEPLWLEPTEEGGDTEVFGAETDSETEVFTGESSTQSSVSSSGNTSSGDTTRDSWATFNFCPECGRDLTPVASPKFCPECGRELP